VSSSSRNIVFVVVAQEPVLGEGESTDLQIDYEKLKVQEKILFFDEV
jgi:hypothetical protein